MSVHNSIDTLFAFEKKAVQEKGLNVLQCRLFEDNNTSYSYGLDFTKGGADEKASGEAEELFPIYSITKMITTLSAMKAMELGLFSEDTPAMDLLKDVTITNQDNLEYLKDLKIKHLLNLTLTLLDSGGGQPLQVDTKWLKENLQPGGTHAELILNQPFANKPGDAYFYSNAGDELISAIIQKQTGKTLANFTKEYVFEPLGIKNFEWGTASDGTSYGSSNVKMTTADLEKLGQLVLNDGKIADKQVIAEKYVKAMKTIQTSEETVNYDYISPTFPKTAYGYGLWITKDGNCFADGKLGQMLAIMPNGEDKRVVTIVSELKDGKQTRELVSLMDVFKEPAREQVQTQDQIEKPQERAERPQENVVHKSSRAR